MWMWNYIGKIPSHLEEEEVLTTLKSKGNGEAEVRALMEERVEAVRDKNVERLMAGYASDVLSFDVVDPLQYVGADGIRTRMKEWFATFQGAIDIENRNLSIDAGE